MNTEQLSMSMFASQAGYDAAIDAIRAEHHQRVTMQHHAADQAQRIADAIDELTTERDELRAELDCAEAEIEVASCALESEDNAVCDGHECMGGYIRAVTQALIKERDDLRARLERLVIERDGAQAMLNGAEAMQQRMFPCGGERVRKGGA